MDASTCSSSSFATPKAPRKGQHEKKNSRDIQTQRAQLEGLLQADSVRSVPSFLSVLTCEPLHQIKDQTSYSEIRERFATLHAFDRKLRKLYEESLMRVQAVEKHIQDLDGRHPEFRTSYHENYERALRESGIKPEKSGLMKFLR